MKQAGSGDMEQVETTVYGWENMVPSEWITDPAIDTILYEVFSSTHQLASIDKGILEVATAAELPPSEWSMD